MKRGFLAGFIFGVCATLGWFAHEWDTFADVARHPAG